MAYIGQSLGLASKILYTFYASEGQSLFTGKDVNGLTLSFSKDLVDVYLNGNLLTPVVDYTAAYGSAIQIIGRTLHANDVLVAISQGAFNPANTYTREEADLRYYGYGAPLDNYRNKIINGNFVIQQRGSSQTSSGYGSDDRWFNGNAAGSTKTHSLLTFSPGQTDVPGNPLWFSRTDISASSGIATYVQKFQAIEDVGTLSGKTATLTFYAKADAVKNMAFYLTQNFGSGGSTVVDGISSTKISLTTSWQKFTFAISIPSISGKTVGSGDSLRINFFFSAGSNLDSLTNSLGLQTGTFDLAHVSFVEGDATGEADPFSPRHIQQEMALCQRYYFSNSVRIQLYSAVANIITFVYYPVQMRAIPSINFSSTTYVNTSNIGTASPGTFLGTAVVASCGTAGTAGFTTLISADAEL